MVTSDREERARVRSRIGKLILEFCWELQARPSMSSHNDEFHMEELRRWVEERVGGKIAPDSPGRVLRELRRKGFINYRVVNRSRSLYQLVLWYGWAEESHRFFPENHRPAEQAELFEARAS